MDELLKALETLVHSDDELCKCIVCKIGKPAINKAKTQTDEIGQVEDVVVPAKIQPGQIWLDDAGIWDAGYDGEMVYIIKSKEPDEPWDLVCFQEWGFGGYMREGFKEEEIRKMKYIGHIKDLRV